MKYFPAQLIVVIKLFNLYQVKDHQNDQSRMVNYDEPFLPGAYPWGLIQAVSMVKRAG